MQKRLIRQLKLLSVASNTEAKHKHNKNTVAQMKITPEKIIQRDPDLVFAYMGDEVVMMTEDQSDYLGLNAVASQIWELIEEPIAVQQLCDKLMERFEVDSEQCFQDVSVFLEDMRARKLVVIS